MDANPGAAHVSPEHPAHVDSAGDPPSASRARFRGRLAAIAALILAVVFLAGLLFLIADDPIGFPLAFVSVFTIAFFGWFFATTRGYRRLLGVPVVLLALIILFMWAYNHKVALPVLIGLLALFGLVARYAVRHARTPMHIAAGKRAPRSQRKEAC